MRKKRQRIEEIAQVSIDKLVHGGQGLGLLPDGRKCFVWGALPGENVNVQITKKKKDWAEGIAVDIGDASKYRIDAAEPEIYMSTSPWQIMDYSYEAQQKQQILAETFKREEIEVIWQPFCQDGRQYGYRNKMEYNFWFDTETNKVSLALHKRGSHQKISVVGSKLASDAINDAGQKLIEFINAQKIEARPLKSVILRSDATGTVGISLFVNDKDIAKPFSKFQLQNAIFEIVYSNPKSPASVATEVIVSNDKPLQDNLLEKPFLYSTRSFFQVNIPVYEAVLKLIAQQIRTYGKMDVIDLYSGVGSIGLSVVSKSQHVVLVELDAEATKQAALNNHDTERCHIVTATAESALDYITHEKIIILDPPRAGLHKDVTERLLAEKPPLIIYLSCNPSTQARDIKLLTEGGYEITYAEGFNFFPRTPHIESLIVLRARV